MKTFWTEQEIESYLKPQTRTVRLPGGRRKALTCFNLTWENMNGLLYYKIFTEEEITAKAEKIAQETRRSFEECFCWVVGDSFGAMKLIHYNGGIPVALIPPVRP